MQSEGWYVTANVLAEAAERLEALEKMRASGDDPLDFEEFSEDCECGEDTCVCLHPTNL
jgi:hypothetical protein